MSLKSEITHIEVVDETGARHLIEEYQSFVQVTTLEGGHDWAPGLRSLQLNGQMVKVIDGQTFEVVATGVRLRRI